MYRENPDVILWVGALTGTLYLNNLYDLKKPIYIVLTGPIHCISELTRIGLKTIIYNPRGLYLHFARFFVPKTLIRASFNSIAVRKIIVLSKRNKEFLERCLVDPSKIVYLPPGREEGKPLDIMEQNDHAKSDFTLVYFGPPFRYRGVDILVRSFKIVTSRIPSRLLILSRLESDPLIMTEHIRLLRLIKRTKLNNVQVVPKFLSRKSLLSYLSTADVIVLPFKIVPSEAPISILEAMWMGKPIISTKVDGIPEFLEDGCGVIIKPNDIKGLAECIVQLYENPALIRKMQHNALCKIELWPTWRQISQKMFALLHGTEGDAVSSLEKLTSSNG